MRRKTFAATCLAIGISGSFSKAATQTWSPLGGNTGGTGTWDTTSNNWDNSTDAWTNTTASNAYFGGTTAGTVTVTPTGINLNTATFGTSGYTVSGGTITVTGGGISFDALGTTSAPIGATITAPIAGVAGMELSGAGYSSSNFTLGSNNSYTGFTILNECTVTVPTITTSGTNSSVGNSGSVEIVGNTSTTDMFYTGAGGTTDRQWVDGGSGVADIANNGSGALVFENTGAAVVPTTLIPGTRKFQFTGTISTSALNIFAETIGDINAGAGSITNVTFAASQWELSGTNTFTGGGTISGAGALVDFTNPSAMGTGSLTYTSGGKLNLTTGMTFSNEINDVAGSTGYAQVFNDTSGNGAGTGVNLTGLITGTGNFRVGAAVGISSNGSIELSNDSNNFTGTFSTVNGFIAYTSVANAGSPSSLGAGSGIYLANSNSTATFQYLGANNDTTTKPLVDQATTGTLNLDSSSPTGSVQYLNTGTLRSGATSTISNTQTIYLTGTGTGSNVLAESINDNAASGTIVFGQTSVSKNLASNWILTGSSTYTGSTTIAAGTLVIDATNAYGTDAANPSASIAGSGTINVTGGTLHLLNTAATGAVTMLSTNAYVSVSTGGVIDLDFDGGIQTVNTFIVNGSPQPAGVYGSTSYTGTDTGTDQAFFSGDGALDVVNSPEPSSIALLGTGGFGLLTRRRRKQSSRL